jgi:hypothetical protein
MRLGLSVDRKGAHLNPLATNLLAGATYFQDFLASNRSFNVDYPPKVLKVLDLYLVLLAGPKDDGFHRRLGKNISAFDSRGLPQAHLRQVDHGRFVRLMRRMLSHLEPMANLLAAIWGIVLFFAVIWLLVTGRISIDDIQLQK